MASPAVLTRGLTSWRGEIDTVFPNRDKSSDGWIGDQAHQSGISGHNPDLTGRAEYKDGDSKNEVRAVDLDADLKNPKFSMEQLVQWVITLARAGAYVPFRYIIYKGRIWARSDGWKTRTYNGKNKHNGHAHFSGDYTQKADEWTGKLGLAAYVKKVTTPPPPKPPATPPKGLPNYKLGQRVLKKGSSPGSDIAHIQRVAGGEKHFGPADGIADERFRQGVIRYQRVVGFSKAWQDGIVGPKTWAMIKKIK